MKKIPYRRAIAMQPGVLESNRSQLVDATAQLRELARPGAVVAIVGIGASYYNAVAALREFWKAGARAFAVDAGQLWEDDFDLADLYLVISASGESLETVAAVERLRARQAGTVVSLTMELSGTLTTMVDLAVACAQLEDSVPATTSYTGGLQALSFLASAWQPAAETARLAQAWAAVPAELERLLATDVDGGPIQRVGERLAEVSAIDFVGTPGAAAGAAEGGLLYREAPRITGGMFESRSYLHGPMEALQEGRGIIVVGDDAATAVILNQAREIGCVGAHITATAGAAEAGSVDEIAIPAGDGRLITAVYEMAALQLLSARTSEKLDLTSGKFRYPQPAVKIKQALT